VLPLDVLIIRACPAAVVGLVAGAWLPARWAIVLAVGVLYVLLLVARRPVSKWPPA